jgi:hypothetical protein
LGFFSYNTSALKKNTRYTETRRTVRIADGLTNNSFTMLHLGSDHTKDPALHPAALFRIKESMIDYGRRTVHAKDIEMLTALDLHKLPQSELKKFPRCQGKFMPDRTTGQPMIELWELTPTNPPRWTRNNNCTIHMSSARENGNNTPYGALARGAEVAFTLSLMYNKAADPVAFNYQRCTLLNTTGTVARSNENIKMTRVTDELGHKGFHSLDHFAYHTVGIEPTVAHTLSHSKQGAGDRRQTYNSDTYTCNA